MLIKETYPLRRNLIVQDSSTRQYEVRTDTFLDELMYALQVNQAPQTEQVLKKAARRVLKARCSILAERHQELFNHW